MFFRLRIGALSIGKMHSSAMTLQSVLRRKQPETPFNLLGENNERRAFANQSRTRIRADVQRRPEFQLSREFLSLVQEKNHLL